MRKNAFTLIELLAVIVILAIIALIAVPIVINIINDAKVSSEEESLKLYEDAVQKMIVKKQMQDPLFKPSTCEIKSNGNLECTVGTKKIDVEVEVKGTKPNKGIITIEGNKVSLKNIWFNGKKYYPIATLKEDVEPAGLSRGDKYEYEVSPGTKYTFFVLEVEGDTVNLIMNNNICIDGTIPTSSNKCLIAWYDDGDIDLVNDTNEFGPITAMQVLYNITKNWINVPDMDLSGDNKYLDEGHEENSSYGYGTIETTKLGIKITKKDKQTEVTREGNLAPVIPYEEGKLLKARLPKYSEVYNNDTTNTTYCHDNYESCPSWLMNGLNYYNSYNQNNISGIKGYWLLSSYPLNPGAARNMFFEGSVNTFETSYSSINGIRPVITVPISDLSN